MHTSVTSNAVQACYTICTVYVQAPFPPHQALFIIYFCYNFFFLLKTSSEPRREAQPLIYQPTEIGTPHDKPNADPYSQGSHRLISIFLAKHLISFFKYQFKMYQLHTVSWILVYARLSGIVWDKILFFSSPAYCKLFRAEKIFTVHLSIVRTWSKLGFQVGQLPYLILKKVWLRSSMQEM